jgi:membrane-bound lytic murein transglycosylase B
MVSCWPKLSRSGASGPQWYDYRMTKGMDLRNLFGSFSRPLRHLQFLRYNAFPAGGYAWVTLPLTLRASVMGLALLGPANAAIAVERLTDEPEVQQFVDDLVAQHGFARSDVLGILSDANVLPEVLEAISRPAERKPWHQYRAIFVTPARIEGGVAFWRAHREHLTRAEQDFGVSPEIIVAIIGVETRYGEYTGRYRVLDALSTLAFRYPKRGRFFRRELQAFLRLSREEGFSPRTIKGSYAGAIGLPQFIPSSYRQYAVDFDGDQIRDLVGNPTDAIGSVANYLSQHGWEKGEGVVFPATLRAQSARKLSDGGIKPRLALTAMQARGVSIGSAAPDQGRGALIELEARDGPEYWVGLQNFYTITRYNHSPLYAMAVYQLAQAIREQVGDAQDS